MKPMMSRPEATAAKFTGPTVEATVQVHGQRVLYSTTRVIQLQAWLGRDAEFKALREVLVAAGLHGQYRDDCMYNIYKAGVILPPRLELWNAIRQCIDSYVEHKPPPRKDIPSESDLALMFRNALEAWIGVK